MLVGADFVGAVFSRGRLHLIPCSSTVSIRALFDATRIHSYRRVRVRRMGGGYFTGFYLQTSIFCLIYIILMFF